MARINSLSDFLNDVSSAIKQKLGDDKPIPASQFDTKIAEIETKGNYQQKSVTISNNGTRIFTPDANYDAIEQIEITTNVPTLQLQTKAVEITSNGNISILPDTNYDGMTQVNLTINVPQESGSGDVKLFDTVEHMQADSTAQEGDMAIVYREELVPITEDSEFDSCIFPNTVVLDEPFTDDIFWYFVATDPTVRCDGTVSLTSSSFDLYETFSGLEIQYTSEDGITYTRTDGGEELQSFGTTIKYEKEYTESEGQFWNNVYGNFMKIGGSYFEGLYRYGDTTPEDLVNCKKLSMNEDDIKTILIPENIIDISENINCGVFATELAIENNPKYNYKYYNIKSGYILATSLIFRIIRNGSGVYKLGVNNKNASSTDKYRVIHILNGEIDSDVTYQNTNVNDWVVIADVSNYNWNSSNSSLTLPDINSCYHFIINKGKVQLQPDVIEIDGDFPANVLNGTSDYTNFPITVPQYIKIPI